MAWQTPKTDWDSSDAPTSSDFNKIEGNINYIEEESRTPNQLAAPAASGKLSLLISFFAAMFKNITGKTNWYNPPDTTLTATKNHMDAAAPHSGHETPTGAQSKVNIHNGVTDPHSATSVATANRLILRDANGRAKVAVPSASDDIARKNEVDTVQSNLDSHTGDANNPHSVSKSNVGLANVDNLSAEGVRTASSNKLRAEVKSSAPSAPVNGDIWYDSANHEFKGRANGAWV